MNTKLTLINCFTRGRNFAAFVQLPVDENDKVHAPVNQLELCSVPKEYRADCMLRNG